MQQRRVGDRTVSAIGLGAMPMSVREHNDEDRALATVRRALDEGITLIDTADAYSPDEMTFGHNEFLVAKALATYAPSDHDVLVATKGGHTRRGTYWELDGRPEYLRQACLDSMTRLGVDQIGLYQHHRPDPTVEYAATMEGLKALLDEGLVAAVGVSNADPDQIRLAHRILGEGLVAVQNQFSPSFRSSQPEIDLCEELGLAFLAWSPLGGMSHAGDLGSRWAVFAEVAERYDASPQQVCLAWELSLSECVIPIPGASRPESVASSAGAVHLQLDEADLAALSASEGGD
jgi:aryl-alcohol dehydrogenase-like predicted oxidoreductase